MDFFDYKPETTDGLKTSKTRFKDILFTAHQGKVPDLQIWPEVVTTYVDGYSVSKDAEKLTESLDLENLGRMVTFLDPITGDTVGEFSVGQFVGMLYSLCIDSDQRAAAARLAALEAAPE